VLTQDANRELLAAAYRGEVAVGWIAGLHHGAHDAACALLHDGELVVLVEQERISRVKRATYEPPRNAFAAALRHADIAVDDIDVVALGTHHGAMSATLGHAVAEVDFEDPHRLFPGLSGVVRPVLPPVQRFPHHLAHAASALFAAGTTDAALLVIDGFGDQASASLGLASQGDLQLRTVGDLANSIGLFYETACRYVGLSPDDAGRLMGLAAFGTDIGRRDMDVHDGQVRWLVSPDSHRTGYARIAARQQSLLARFTEHHFPHRSGCGAEDVLAYADFAATVQATVEQVVLHLAQGLRAETGPTVLAYAGGVALNCSANGLLAEQAGFSEIVVPPVAADAGVALGAGVLAHAHATGSLQLGAPMRSAGLGLDFLDEEIEAAVSALPLATRKLGADGIAAATVDLICSGAVVGWFQGRAEIGPRALGRRSVLADPTARWSHVRVNRVKGREMWRPVAPSVLVSEWDRYFVGRPSRFMLARATVREDWRPVFPAIVHVDGSARPQAVDDDGPDLFPRLLNGLRDRTGFGMVVNSSLNGPGEPIAHHPSDAVDLFLRSELDALAIGPFLVTK